MHVKEKKAEGVKMGAIKTNGRTLWCLILIGFACIVPEGFTFETSGQRPGYSPHSPAPMGVSAVAQIEYNTGYVFEVLASYEARITVLEMLRGEKAWDRVKAADRSNRPPQVGFEYVLARIRFELSVVEDIDKRGYKVRPWRFIAVSSDGNYYDTPVVVVPKPALEADLKSGDCCEGWVVFLVAEDDNKPLMNFGRSPLCNDDEYLGIWFQLY
jgi:hypothetical protein